ncbi:MAG: circularly permuted type 2 ATP-grasp protein [Pseudomonadota bacterium]
MHLNWDKYPIHSAFDETVSSPSNARMPSRKLLKYFNSLGEDELKERLEATDTAIKTIGISFTVYSDSGNIDRQWPLDIIPRIIANKEWSKVEKGLIQRLTALNCFINDIYNDKKIFKDNVVPIEIILNSPGYQKQCENITLPHNTWAHVCGTDLIRDDRGKFLVLEDNLRIPSGVSYMLENRRVTKRVLPELFQSYNVKHLGDYPNQLLETLKSIAPTKSSNSEVVVLTPGIYNSAYFEHSYLAQQMGAELVEGCDLVVEKDKVFMKTVAGLRKVDVIYRRVDDLYLDPEVFNKDSLLGVKGLMRAWRKGNVSIANAPGAGVADDKVVYTYVPKLIKYYLNEEPILDNVESYQCSDPKEREYVLKNINKLVIKPANESGGYGMLIGPQASNAEIEKFKSLIKKNSRNYMAQPLISLSTCPVITNSGAKPRHIDLRPFILQSKSSYVTPGGLTRVAMKQGSYVVNSSQGGGSKDTWIIEP